MHEIIPGILEHNWKQIEAKIEQVKAFAPTIHIDLLDGQFAPNSTFSDPEPFKKYTGEILFELHMMVKEPIQYVQAWAQAGFQRFIGHIEAMSDQVAFVALAQEHGEVGLALDGPTSLDQIHVPLRDLDTLLVFTAKQAGYSGQSFLKERLKKVAAVAKEVPFLPIEVDGGINEQTILAAQQKGATRFVTTSALFGTSPCEEQYHRLSSLVTS